jgi:hypothetical protein
MDCEDIGKTSKMSGVDLVALDLVCKKLVSLSTELDSLKLVTASLYDSILRKGTRDFKYTSDTLAEVIATADLIKIGSAALLAAGSSSALSKSYPELAAVLAEAEPKLKQAIQQCLHLETSVRKRFESS